MSQERIVLVTGVASPWGSRVAEKLLTEAACKAACRSACSIIGLDAECPAEDVPGLDFVRADIRNPLLVDLLKANEVDTVCHLAFAGTRRRSETAFDLNVMGTAKLMSACAAAGVRKVVLKSSMAVYGARATNSAFLCEDHGLRGSRRYGYIRDMVEVESFCSDFRRRVQAKSKPEREAKRSALVVADDAYQEALKMLNGVKTRGDTLNRELEEAKQAMQIHERRFRWRERWLGFLSTVPSRAANFTVPEVERIKGSQAEGDGVPPGFIEKH